MKDDLIANNPSFTKYNKELAELKQLKSLIPILKQMGMDTQKIDEAFEQIQDLERTLDELRNLPDQFNKIFSEHGWIFSEIIKIEAAKEAINKFKSEGLEKAQNFLVDYYSPDWVEKHLVYLQYLPEFSDRFALTEKAFEDYKEGRYYASIFVILSMIDGWVNDLNIVEFQRKGFFDKEAKLVAWDSVTAHSKGLVKLQEVFSKMRMKTRTDEITIPYRNGIVHGMDLGFDNAIVAAKCWAALFAVRDWVIKARKGELEEPQQEFEKEKTLKETIDEYQKTKTDIEKLKSWEPRSIVVGKDIPLFGKPENFPSDTPEQILAEFLEYWKTNNYGYMAKCYASMYNIKPAEIREIYSDYQLIDYEIVEIIDKFPWTTEILIRANLQADQEIIEKDIIFLILCNTRDGKLANVPNEDTKWGVAGRTYKK